MAVLFLMRKINIPFEILQPNLLYHDSNVAKFRQSLGYSESSIMSGANLNLPLGFNEAACSKLHDAR